jgi:hypothetical protein
MSDFRLGRTALMQSDRLLTHRAGGILTDDRPLIRWAGLKECSSAHLPLPLGQRQVHELACLF